MASNVIAWGNNASGQTNVPASATNVIAVSSGFSHTIALRSNGSVVAWGDNSFGETTVPVSATNVIAIAAGGFSSLALRADGTVVGWGWNSDGQVAGPATETNVTAIAAGGRHTLVLFGNGRVVAWGNNINKQSTVPATATNIVAIAAAGDHSVALRSDGLIIAWGLNTFRQTNSPYYIRDAVAVSAGWTYDLALRADGKVLSWGTGGRVGTNATDAIMVAVGTNFSMVLHSNATVTAWGMGTNLVGITNVPATVSNIVAISAGDTHCVAVVGTGLPQLTQPPFSGEATVGNALPLYVQASGEVPLHYQWLADEVPIVTPDSPLPRLPAVIGHDDVAYRVVVSNGFGSVTSSVVRMTVKPLGGWGDNLSRQLDVPKNATNCVMVAAGAFHSLGLQQDGSTFAWGKNADGQATVPAVATNVVAVAGGGDHSLALRDDGTVLAWGRDWSGQTDVPNYATNVVAIAAGWAHSLALKADGTVVAWGDNIYGQCAVSFLANQVTAIAAGYYHNLALKSDGTVVAWGWDNTVSPDATNVIAIAAGSGHSLALRADGTVVAWGDNSFGQINVPAAATNVIAINAGAFHSVAIRGDGTVVVWGSRYLEVTNAPGGLTNVITISAGQNHNLVLASAGALRFYRQVSSLSVTAGGQLLINASLLAFGPSLTYQWYQDGVAISDGTNRNLVLKNLSITNAGTYTLEVTATSGKSTSQPVMVSVQANPATLTSVGAWGDNIQGQTDIPLAILDARAVSAGAFHSLVLSSNGTVTAWGKNRDGQTNVPPLAATNVMSIAAGGDHSLALTRDGAVIAWGRNWDGQTNVPPSATNIIAISAGWAHSVALRSDGKVLTWGNNDVDQTNVPVTLSNVIKIAGGYYHTLALRADHKVISWGLYSSVPESATNVVAIAGGWGHSLALRADGQVVAWGDNSYGQTNVPPAATNVIALAAGYYCSLALRSDGSLVAWGRGFYGVTNIPSGLRDVVSIAAGEDYCLALRELGPPRIALDPKSLVLHSGGHTVFAGEAGGSQPLTFQWVHDGTALSDATNHFLFIDDVKTSDAGTYTFVAANTITQAASQPGTLTVLREPFVETNPLFTNALVGQPFCLPATITGEAPMTYQWMRNGVAVSDGDHFSGSTSPTLCITNAQVADGGDYQIILQNPHGNYTGLVTHLSATPIIAWGDNFGGQLDVPPDAGDVVAIAGGSDHSLALRSDGSLVTWGDNTFGQTSIPPGATNIVSIAAYGEQSMALTADGRVLAWGENRNGLTNVPASLTNVMAISTSDTHSIALRGDGSVQAWGIGPGLAISGPKTAIAAGSSYSMGLDSYGDVIESGLFPRTIPPTYKAIAAGLFYRMAMSASGEAIVYSTGGNGDTGVFPSSVTNLAAIAAGFHHLLFLGSNGIPIALGDNSYGQTNISAQAINLVAIAAGSDHSLALSGSSRSTLAKQTSTKTVTLGDATTLVARSIGNSPATYQWQFNGSNIANATNAALALFPVRWTNAGVYRVLISDAFGSVTGPSTSLSVLPPVLRFDSAYFQVTSNSVQMRLLGASGTSPLILYASTNLVDWVPVLTNTPINGGVIPVEPSLTDSDRTFYRAAEVYSP